MKKFKSIWLMVGLILLMMALGVFLGTQTHGHPPHFAKNRVSQRSFGEEEGRSYRENASSSSNYIIIKSAITMVNIALSLMLIAIYIRTYREVKSEFTGGLLVIMFAFLIYAITSNPYFGVIFGYWSFGLGPFMIIPDICATFALGILLHLSLK